MGTVHLAKKYSAKVDERFSKESRATLVTNQGYDWNGVNAIVVSGVDTAPMHAYRRTGKDRYGSPADLGDTEQTLTITQDQAWTFIIDKGDKIQSMIRDAGKAVSRQLREVVMPTHEAYVYNALAKAASNNSGHHNETPVTKNNAYEVFLAGQEALGNDMVPDEGRICIASYAYANKLMLDNAFVKESNTSQEMVRKGVIGTVDGVRIVRVPASRLPDGCEFILTHPVACVAPIQLKEYKVHTDAPGISGWLVEGRIIFDAFVLEQKKNAIYYCGTSYSPSSEAILVKKLAEGAEVMAAAEAPTVKAAKK